MLSVYDYWQFWRNTEDGDVGRFLAPLHRYAARRNRPARSAAGRSELNEAKKILATEATALLHGRDAATSAARNRARAPSRKAPAPKACPPSRLRLPDGVLNLAVAAGLASSNSEARKLIVNNGLKVNDVTVSDPKLDDRCIGAQQRRRAQTVRAARKKHVLVKASLDFATAHVAARRSSRRSLLKSVHWTDLTSFAGRISRSGRPGAAASGRRPVASRPAASSLPGWSARWRPWASTLEQAAQDAGRQHRQEIVGQSQIVGRTAHRSR